METVEAAVGIVSAAIEIGSYMGGVVDDLKSQSVSDREEFTKAVVSQLAEAHPAYNVIVYKEGGWEDGPDDVQEQGTVEFYDTFETVTFYVYVVGAGKFVRGGDGGFINWCFQGTFERDDNQVTFSTQQ